MPRATIWDNEAESTRIVNVETQFEAALLSVLDRIASTLERIANSH